jgi:exopolysaccharide production protein ExoQ
MHIPPIVATLVYLTGIAWLFRRDFREKPNVTAALWLPFIWVFLSGTRYFSQWLNLFGLHVGGVSVEEGSPMDALLFFVLVALGLYVLHQRRVSLTEFVRNNQWVVVYLAYCLLAVAWSDHPFVSLKRWVKLFGQPIMVLVLLSEPDPMEALVRLFKRSAYVWVPISVLFIKYYPQWGRSYSFWNGEAQYSGICLGKNALGFLCMVVGIFFFWHFLTVWSRGKGPARRKELILCLVFLVMNGWLLNMAQSSTPLICMLAGMGMVWFTSLRIVNLRRIGFYLLAGIAFFAIAQGVFGVYDYVIINLLGKSPTLTGRTEVWQILLKAPVNPALGSGFESFWMSDYAQKLNSMYDSHSVNFNEAHNAYLETYLQLGLLGVALTIGLIGAAYVKARRALINDFNLGRFRFAFLAAMLLYGWTEVVFRMNSVPFFMFLLAGIDPPRRQAVAASQSVEANAEDRVEADLELASVQTQNRFADVRKT